VTPLMADTTTTTPCPAAQRQRGRTFLIAPVADLVPPYCLDNETHGKGRGGLRGKL